MNIKWLNKKIIIFQSFWNLLLIFFLLLGFSATIISCWEQTQFINFLVKNEFFSRLITILLSFIKVVAFFLFGLLSVHKRGNVYFWFSLAFLCFLLFVFPLTGNFLIFNNNLSNSDIFLNSNNNFVLNFISREALTMLMSFGISLILELSIVASILSILTFFCTSFELAFQSEAIGLNTTKKLALVLREAEEQKNNIVVQRTLIENSLENEIGKCINNLNTKGQQDGK